MQPPRPKPSSRKTCPGSMRENSTWYYLNCSHIQVGELGVLLDVAEAFFGFAAHQLLHELRGCAQRALLGVIGEHHLEQGALARMHRGFLKLARRHLAKSLEAADLDLAAAVERFL